MTVKPEPKCPVFHDQECWCRRNNCECPVDMTPLNSTDLKRTLELAKQHGWESDRGQALPAKAELLADRIAKLVLDFRAQPPTILVRITETERDQIVAALRAQPRSDEVREAVIEECVRVADALTKKWGQPNGEPYSQGANDHGIRIASNIRALKSAPEGEKTK